MTDGWRDPARDHRATRVDEPQGQLNTQTATRPRKTGSAMSDKQIARAAVEGRKIVFYSGVLMPVEGYVVGMDDYHWLIATPSERDLGVQTALVHKTCPLVSFTGEFLAGEIDEDREKIRSIGRTFWDFCISHHLTRSVPTDKEQQ